VLRNYPLKGPLGISIAALALSAIVLLAQLPSLFGAALSSGPSEGKADEMLEQFATAGHDEVATKYVSRFEGRYLFYPPPPPPPPKPPPKKEAPPGPPPEPPKPIKPTTYGGPTPQWVLGDLVWFKDSDRGFGLRVGEKNAEVMVISTDAPWSVKLLWKEVEFDVKPMPSLQRGMVSGSPGPSSDTSQFFLPLGAAQPARPGAAPAPPVNEQPAPEEDEKSGNVQPASDEPSEDPEAPPVDEPQDEPPDEPEDEPQPAEPEPEPEPEPEAGQL
jgi:hypothetical protein